MLSIIWEYNIMLQFLINIFSKKIILVKFIYLFVPLCTIDKNDTKTHGTKHSSSLLL